VIGLASCLTIRAEGLFFFDDDILVRSAIGGTLSAISEVRTLPPHQVPVMHGLKLVFPPPSPPVSYDRFDLVSIWKAR